MSVYYVLAPDLGMVKIGYAEHVRNRFSKMQTDSPTRLVLVGIEDGAEDAEALLHQQFHAFRRRGEWFSVEGAVAHTGASILVHSETPNCSRPHLIVASR